MAYLTRAMRDRARADRLEERCGADLLTLRQLDNAFSEQAIRDREAKFPVLSAANADAAITYQATRIDELRKDHAEYQAALARVRRAR